jgi:hypothetical protein
MTEGMWLAAQDPRFLLDGLHDQGRLSERKAPLFRVACCRLLSAHFPDDRLRAAIAVVERLADAAVGPAGRKAARRAVQQVPHDRPELVANRMGGAVYGLAHR